MDKYAGEKVLVVKKNILFEKEEWQGLKTENLDYYYNLIQNNYEFIDRNLAEEDENYQQVIPYILFKNDNKFFLYEYLKDATEERLHHNYILGIAGHINPIDENGKDVIENGMMREWREEVEFSGTILNKKLLGILNDNRREVEKVHLGLIYIFEGDNSDIILKEKNKMRGKMMSLSEMKPLIGNADDLGWAPLIYPYLKNIK